MGQVVFDPTALSQLAAVDRRPSALVCCALSVCWWVNGHDPLAEADGPAPVLTALLSRDTSADAKAETPTAPGKNERAGARSVSSSRPQIAWPDALRRVRAWLEPLIMLGRYWRRSTALSPPGPLQAMLDWVVSGHPIQLHDASRYPL